jgi:uncharacterized protein
MSNIVIYHAGCPDGFTAAWVFHKKYGDGNTEYMAAGHGDYDKLLAMNVEGLDVFFIDYCPPRNILNKYLDTAASLTVLDHHKSAIDIVEGLPNVIMDMDRSGAGIAWDFCFPDEPRAPIVEYVQDRDIWLWKIEDSKPVLSCLDQVAYEFDNWTNFDNELRFDKQAIISKGLTILSYQNKMINDHKKKVHRVTLGDYNVPAVNSSYSPINSELASQLSVGEPFGITYSYDGKHWQVSLRNDGNETSVDVSKVATKFGGGGHRNASGINCEHPVWTWVAKTNTNKETNNE